MTSTEISPLDRLVDLPDRVKAIAASDPDRVALIHAHRGLGRSLTYERHTYGELSDRAEALASGLRQIGVREGTRCSFMVPPGMDAVVVGVALWRVGAVFVGIEPHGHGLAKVGRSLAKASPEVFVGSALANAGRIIFGWGRSSVQTKIVTSRHRRPGCHSVRSLEALGRAAGAGGGDDLSSVAPSDPSAIFFTTGSTGAPKPTVLRQRNFRALTDLLIEEWDFAGRTDVVDMLTFPAFWIIGLAAGGTVVVPPMDFTHKGPGDADPELLLRTIEDCGVTSMFASPALLTNLSAHAARTGRPTALRRIVAGGAEVLGPLVESVREHLAPDGEIYCDYGATEALPLSEIAGASVVDETWKRTEDGEGLCVGTPFPGVDVRIVAVSDHPIATMDDATVLPAGEIGEVVARAPHFSEDYFRQPQADLENKIGAVDGAWHRVGDTGYLDEEGRLWVCGRRGQRVETRLGTAYPLCCEPVFNTHPAVARSALVGIADNGTTRAVMCVELAEPVADRDLLAVELMELAEQFEATRCIERVHFLDKLPVDRRHNAKIDRPAIAAAIS